jgi:hypothetical protein
MIVVLVVITVQHQPQHQLELQGSFKEICGFEPDPNECNNYNINNSSGSSPLT